MKKLFILLNILSLFIGNVFAGHPLRGDDAVTVGANNIQLELLSDFSYGRGGNHLSVPLTLTYGLFNNADVIVAMPYNYCDQNKDEWGASDISLEFKYAFYLSENFHVAVKPVVSFPTANHVTGFGNGEMNYGFNISISRASNEINLHLNSGYCFSGYGGEAKAHQWNVSLGGEWMISDSVIVLAETGISENYLKNINKKPIYVLLGLNYTLNDYITISLGLINGTNDYEIEKGILGGLTFIF